MYALRNLFQSLPGIRRLAVSGAVRALVEPYLGGDCFAVRALYFDKLPGANWSVPLHQDLSVALAEERNVEGFGPWSRKAGVLHAQAPGSENWTQTEVEYRNPQKEKMVRNVARPTLTVYLPDKSKANGTAVIVCPGGGFRFLSWETEGTQLAEFLRERGVAAFVLKYRLVDTGATEAEFQKALEVFFRGLNRRPADGSGGAKPGRDLGAGEIPKLAAEDGRQAIRVVRQRAAEWGIAPNRIGILGFSAGGMVASDAALRHDAGSRPDFAAPIYGAPWSDTAAPADAPPLFLLCADDDALAATACVRLYSTWKSAGKSAEIHVYSRGGHGFGMRKQGLPIDHWAERFTDWLGVKGLLKPPR